MRRIQVLLAFIVVAFLILPTGWAFAGDGKAQGQPFQYLQQQIDQLRGQLPVQPDIQGCWAGSFIVTQTGGSAPSQTGMPTSGVPPFYWNPGRKMLDQLYMMVESQSGTQIKGTYIVWLGQIPCPVGGRCGFFEFPFEGYVNGNLFQLYSSTTDSPYNQREEQRYLNGILTKDPAGKMVIHGMGVTSRDVATAVMPDGVPDQTKHSWNNIVFTFTMNPYEGSCDALPNPDLGDVIQGQFPPYYGPFPPPSQ